MKLSSYAKVNLFLNVLSKRKDGFHDIETLFERISLKDELVLSKISTGIKITTDSHELPTGPKNLVYQAAKLLSDLYHPKQGVKIKLRKRIPLAAGLGGGSSNAAAALEGLNKLWHLKLSQKKLLKLGAMLGSDVPFFLLETSFALGQSRGEILKPFKAPKAKIWHCLVKPSFGISTKEAYANLDNVLLAPPPVLSAKRTNRCGDYKKQVVRLTPKAVNVKILGRSIEKGDLQALVKLLTNSLELTLNKRVTEILKIKKELTRHGAMRCLLSGSGPTVFGIYSSQKKALSAARFLRKHKRWQVFAASTF
ncbi:MAG: 4-(cytidine 5'-diphospho)-2-C-methyl-D-erythritol kinase [Candidatus Omnitrophica bacterium CG1_02_46_14]|nr:MAG: 4-(cytidine 5'-diphospho)-2-C-methyl-D-erythritol kinase [Candidatus Omnitrophica bacterium CG1_02_46_14]